MFSLAQHLAYITSTNHRMNRQKEIDLEQGITSYTNIILSTVESCLWSRDLILSLKTLIVDPSNP